MTVLNLTRNQADLAARHFIGDYTAEHGNDGSEIFDQFRRNLSTTIEADLDRDYLWDAVDSYARIGLALDGELEECEVNAAGTIDNRAEVADHYSQQLASSLNMMFDGTRINGAWVIR